MMQNIVTRLLAIALLLLPLAGCVTNEPLNPSFPLTVDDARSEIDAMAAAPKPAPRPVLVVGGYMDLGIMTNKVAGTIASVTGERDQVLPVRFFMRGSFEACRDHLIREVEAAYPSDDPHWTREVDVIGGSMGGIVARFAAMPPEPDADANADAKPIKRLKIARLFTVSSPHCGAKMATLPTFDSRVIDMREDSAFLHKLDAALVNCGYELVPYVRLGDVIVGEANAAPQGVSPWWVQNQPLEFAHLNSFRDERILADISRRLRGESPYTTSPAAPLPARSEPADGYGIQ